MKYLATFLTLGALTLGGFACDDRKSHEKHEYKRDDGTTVKEEKKVTENEEGDKKVTIEKEVDRP
jgi:hypothetical protein